MCIFIVLFPQENFNDCEKIIKEHNEEGGEAVDGSV